MCLDLLHFLFQVIGADGVARANNFIEGLTWVLDDFKSSESAIPAVVNPAFPRKKDAAWTRSSMIDFIDAGLVLVAGAGSLDQDSCDFSPSDVKDVIIVASTSKYDE